MKDGNIYKNLLEAPIYEDLRDGLKIKGFPSSMQLSTGPIDVRGASAPHFN
jgi:hypothetical protein